MGNDFQPRRADPPLDPGPRRCFVTIGFRTEARGSARSGKGIHAPLAFRVHPGRYGTLPVARVHPGRGAASAAGPAPTEATGRARSRALWDWLIARTGTLATL